MNGATGHSNWLLALGWTIYFFSHITDQTRSKTVGLEFLWGGAWWEGHREATWIFGSE